MTEPTKGTPSPEQLQAIHTAVRDGLACTEVILENHRFSKHLDRTTLNMARRTRRQLLKALKEF